MGSTAPTGLVRVAVTQHEPVWLDLEGAVTKTIAIIKQAAAEGAKLVAFPECWIPGYPAWIWSRPVDFDLGVKYVQNSLKLNSPEMKRICAAAEEHGINVSLGFSERDGESVYIAQALIDEAGLLQMARRKMKPTHMERTIFGDASGDCLAKVVNLPQVGAVGGLSCWEHIQPLLKYYTFSQGEQIHVAAWPPLDGFIQGSPGFYSMSIEGCRNQSQSYAIEAGAYVLHATTVITEKGIGLMGTAGSPIMGHPIVGSSAVIGPDGRILSAPETANEQLIIADLDLSLITKTKTFADASGHYSRPDMLWLGADERLKKIVRVDI
ncbi:carbon-nitrogen hydrolase [Neohortaea acidophila]|uniref:nitrilase n=1 Tax=Neohortaea acidophila TaxID=245834 RepID=A0A6A6PRQ3_9PEZI|nr:carbon-nitrogen hydrolase [Neohortaea acidophila]KAF2482334.1 carbon-nitrogen hydrolase [Neohortaea acidophila]